MNKKGWTTNKKIVIPIFISIISISVLLLYSGNIIGYLTGFDLTEGIAVTVGNMMPLSITGKGLFQSRKGKMWGGVKKIFIYKGNEIVPYLLQYGLQSDDPLTRRHSAAFLRFNINEGEIPEQLDNMLSVCISIMKKETEEEVLYALYPEFKQIGVKSLNKLGNVLPNLPELNAYYVVEAIKLFDEKAMLIYDKLISLASSDKWYIRRGVCQIFAKIGPEADKAIPRLILLLNDSNAQVRAEICAGLGEIGFKSPKIVDRLLYVVNNDKSKEVRVYAAGSLAKTGIINNKIIRTVMNAIQEEDIELLLAGLKAVKEFPVEILNQNMAELRKIYSKTAKADINVQEHFLYIFSKCNEP